MTSGPIVLDTPEGIEMFNLLRLASAVALEINTGMKASRGSALKTLASMGISTKRTKRGALADLVAHIKTKHADYKPGASVQRALDGK